MRLFLLVYLAVYGAMLGYSLRKIHVALACGWRGALLLALGGLLALSAPFLLQRLSGEHAYPLVRAFAFLVWTAMALVFWFIMLNFVTDLWNLGTQLVSVFLAEAGRWRIAARPAILAQFAILLVASGYGYVEAGRVRLKTVKVPTIRLPMGSAPLRILQIADLHLGRTSRPAVFDTVLRLVREAHADLLLSSGDLVDAADAVLEPAMQRLAEIRPPLGKFAVLGNHEIYPGADRTTRRLEIAGFTVLRERSVAVGDHLIVAGVDDPAVRYAAREGKPAFPEDRMILSKNRDGRFVLFLKHQPRVTDEARGRVDLQLSGHTHQGQIFPFAWFVRLFYPYSHGRLLTFPEGLRLYVSPGAGTWGPPFRVFARPEVTLFVLTPAAAP